MPARRAPQPRTEPPVNRSPQLFGETIRLLRKAAGLTQDELASRISTMGGDLSEEMISYIERGEKLGSITTYWNIARALDVDIRDVVKVIDPKMPQALLLFLQTLEDDGETPPSDDELAYLRTVAVPGRKMTRKAYEHALALFRAARKTDEIT